MDDHCAVVKVSDFGNVLNVNISFIRGRMHRGETIMFNIVGIEVESSIRP